MHILLVNNYTKRGGIPAVIAGLANAMHERGHEVSIVSQKPVPRPLHGLYNFGRKLADLASPPNKLRPLPLGTFRLEEMYPLRDGIKIIPYNFSDKNLRIQILRQKIRQIKPDACVCPLPDGSQLVWAVTLLGTGVPYIYSEHHNPDTIEKQFWSRKGRLAAMSGADAIHLLLPSYLDSLPDFLRDRARIIPNAIELPEACASPVPEAGTRHALLWLGRLHEDLKQCRLAMDAFALLARQYPQWDLHIAGDGQDRKMLEAHAKKLMAEGGLQGRIKFLGEQTDVPKFLASGHAFCFSSRTEGLPLALLEALAAGLPVAAFSGCPGVCDIISHEKNGLLAGEMTANAMAAELERLFRNADLRVELGKNARASLEKFSSQNVYDAWEKLLLETAARESAEMDSFGDEPFASLARLSSCARREWLWRDFGKPFPYSFECYLKYFIKTPFSWLRKIFRGER